MKQLFGVLSVSLFEAITYGYVIISIAIFIAFSIFNHNNYLQLYFDSLKSASTITQNYERVSTQINSNEYVANGTIFIFWAIVGLLVYYLVYFLFISERNMESFFHTLFTRGVDRVDLLEHAFASMGIRVLAVIGLLVETVLFVRSMLPHLIVNSNIADIDSVITKHWLPLFWTAVGIFIYLHVGAILLRCLTLRTRTFF
jgi:hypothetical protein